MIQPRAKTPFGRHVVNERLTLKWKPEIIYEVVV